MKKMHLIILCIISFFACGCSDYFWCSVSGYGTTPQNKTYYVEPIDSSFVNDFQYIEFEQLLKERLNESGYIETAKESAALCVRFSYFIGERELKGISSYSMTNGSSYSFGTVTSNTKTARNTNTISNINGNTIKTNAATKANSKTTTKGSQFTYSGNRTQGYSEPTYKQPVLCIVETFESSDLKPVWKVEAKDELPDNSSLRKVMPWILSSAQQLFGKNGEENVIIKRKDGERNKGLIWPY